MRKKILILSNPGREGAENYCEGVKRDVDNYKQFFLSPVGGNWYESEIDCRQYATKSEVLKLLKDMRNLDFSIIIFVGHGYSQYNRSYVELKPSIWQNDTTNDMDTEEFRESACKRIVILDCCRKEWVPLFEHNAVVNRIEKSFSMYRNTREIYESVIEEMPIMNLFLYGCDLGETSGDDSRRGGYYSSALLDVCYQKAQEYRHKQERYYVSAVQAHELAIPLVKKKKYDQNPQIEKPRSEPYLPLAIV